MSGVDFREVKGDPQRKSPLKKILPHVLLFFLAVAFYFMAGRTGLFTMLDLEAYDLFFRLRNRISVQSVPQNIVVVAIDEASMKEIGIQWPWPRAIHGDLVTALTSEGAAVILFDVLFVDPSDPANDQAFAAAMKRSGCVVLAEDFTVEEDATFRQETWTRRQTWVRPLDLFLDSARATGLATVVRDPDGFVRRAFLETNGIPLMDRVALEILKEERGEAVQKEPSATFGIPRGAAEPVLINYLGPPHSIHTVSYFEALEPAKYLPKGLLKGAVVLVGRSLAGAADLKDPDHFPYPFLRQSRSAITGVEIHATLIDTLLRRRYLCPVPPWKQHLLFLLVLGAAALSLAAIRRWYASLVFWAIIALYAGGLFAAFFWSSRVLIAATPLVSAAAYFVAERAYQIVVVDREKRFLQNAFKHYVSPAYVDRLVANPELLNLNGERCEVTVVFTDLEGFTSVAEKMEPMALRRFLTGYFTEMVDIFLSHDGTLDKFIGDAIMCFFGAPLRAPAHAHQGLLTAWQMHARLIELNVEWGKQGLPPLTMRIGVNSGPVVAGNMGTKALFNYTIMGDMVNLGSRLEGANKNYGTSIMMSETTRELAGDRFDARLLDRIRVKGKAKPLTVYELLGPRGTATAERLARARQYEEAFEAYQKREFEAAVRLLEDLLRAGEDSPSTVLLNRCREYAFSPPYDNWDGVYTMKTK